MCSSAINYYPTVKLSKQVKREGAKHRLTCQLVLFIVYKRVGLGTKDLATIIIN